MIVGISMAPPPSLEGASGSSVEFEIPQFDNTLGALLLGTFFGLMCVTRLALSGAYSHFVSQPLWDHHPPSTPIYLLVPQRQVLFEGFCE